MRKLIPLLTILFLQLVWSCKNNSYEIKIQNNANVNIDSMFIYPSGSNSKKRLELNTGETKIHNINLNEFPESDGSYILNYKLDGKWNIKSVGYFTNGSPLEKGTFISIEDTIIKSRPYKY